MEEVSGYGEIIGSQDHTHTKPITTQGTCWIRFLADLLNINGSWNQEVLQNYFLPADVMEINKIRASPRQEEDVIAWGAGKYCRFLVKSAYDFAFEQA